VSAHDQAEHHIGRFGVNPVFSGFAGAAGRKQPGPDRNRRLCRADPGGPTVAFVEQGDRRTRRRKAIGTATSRLGQR